MCVAFFSTCKDEYDEYALANFRIDSTLPKHSIYNSWQQNEQLSLIEHFCQKLVAKHIPPTSLTTNK